MRTVAFRIFISIVLVATVDIAGTMTAAARAAISCNAQFNAPQQPFRIFGDTYYVGTHGVGAILIASGQGLVLIDGDLPESAPQIVANIRALGFRAGNIKLILNTHVHCDHAGGIAELQRISGASVKASPSSAAVLKQGGVGRDDPQSGIEAPITPVPNVGILADGQTLKVGPIALTAHFTPGHTSGGTSWTWEACEKRRCLHIVYADSLAAVSAPGFRFTRNAEYPNALADFDRSFAVLSALPCDILVTVHPEVSDLWTRLDRRSHGNPRALVDSTACRRLVDSARTSLAKRVAWEKAQR